MNILMITPGIDPNNDVFGFVHSQIISLASKVDKLTVITLRPTNDVPSNVKVIPIKDGNRFSRFLRLNKAIHNALRDDKFDLVYGHMYLEFSLIAIPYLKLFPTPLVIWYEHSSTPLKLKIVHKFAKKIFSASKHGFRLPSNKSVVMGQCVDTSSFKPVKNKNPKEILSVSRLSRSKNIHTMIDAIAKLNDKDLKLTVVGSPPDEDSQKYLDGLKEQVKNLNLDNQVKFAGFVNHNEVKNYYNKAAIFINTSKTQSLDKTGIEAMASGLLLLASNPAYSEVLEGYKHKDILTCSDEQVADKLAFLLKLPEKKKAEISNDLRKIAIEGHSVEHLTSKMVEEFNKLLANS